LRWTFERENRAFAVAAKTKRAAAGAKRAVGRIEQGIALEPAWLEKDAAGRDDCGSSGLGAVEPQLDFPFRGDGAIPSPAILS
jgi:hypothetical protein